MKKRKPPVVLATCLVLMLVAVAIVYAPNRGGDEHAQMPQPPPPSAEQGDRPKMTPQQISSISAKKGGPKGAPGPMGAPGKLGEATGPSVVVPKQEPYKPTPNESSTSTQWYTDQTKK